MFGRRKKLVECDGCKRLRDDLWRFESNEFHQIKKIVAAYWLCDGDRRKFQRAMKFLKDFHVSIDDGLWNRLADIRIGDEKGD